MGPAWSTGFAGADLALGASLDLRKFVASANRAALTFALNPGSALIAGVLTLTSTGVFTRIGHGAIAGVLIDVVSYGAGVNGGDTAIFPACNTCRSSKASWSRRPSTSPCISYARRSAPNIPP